MFFIAGTEQDTSTVDSGTFLCPACKDYCQYQLVQPKSSVTLFFVPVWQADDGAPYVECRSCGNGFSPDVLDASQECEEAIAEFLDEGCEHGNESLLARDPLLARQHYDKAIECYRRALELPMTNELRENVEEGLDTLIDIFPSQCCMGEALGLCDEAETLGHVDMQLPLLRKARDILQKGLEREDDGYDNIMSIYVQIIDRIEKAEALSDRLAEKGEPTIEGDD